MISKYKANKNLLNKLKQHAGRNNQGRITVAHKGGGHKQNYRKINFKRDKGQSIVTSIEYDPNRSANIAQLSYKDKKKNTYIIAPNGLRVLDEIISSEERKSFINIGDTYKLKDLPMGTIIHNIELLPNQGGKLIRSAGTYAKVLQPYNNKYINIQLSSGEQRLILADCKVSVGAVSNIEHKSIPLKKAGQARWLNRRPTVRGVAMNPVDHPHGGGEGKSSGGRPSVTPWGRPTKGQPTRSKRKNNKFILIKRNKK
jgi:large subunit ribosomal protein L2